MEHKRRKLDDQNNLTPDLVGGSKKLGYKNSLDIFGNIPVVQNCIAEKETVKISPVTALMQNSRVIDFVIGAYDNYVYDPSSMRVNMKLAVLVNGNPVGPSRKPKDLELREDSVWDPVSIINNIGSSMFQRVTVWVNDVETFSSNSNHPYRSWIENSIAFSSDNKYSVLKNTQGFINDAGEPSSCDTRKNIGAYLRSDWTSDGKSLYLSGKLSHDCLNTGGKVLPPGTLLRMRLERASDAFCLMWDDANAPETYKTNPPIYTLDLKSVQVEIERFKLEQTAVGYISSRMANEAARYYLSRIEMREQFIPQSTLEWSLDNIYGLTQVPLRIFFGLCPIVAKNGTIDSNPLSFAHYDVSEITVKINERVVQTVRIREWKGSAMLEAYVTLLKALRVLNKAVNLDLDMESWSGGPLTILGFDLSKDNSDNTDPIPGSVSIGLRFSKPTPVGLAAVFYGNYQGTMFIHGDRTVECYDSVVVNPSKHE